MEVSTLIERGFAITYVSTGLSLILSPRVWRQLIDDIREPKNALALGFIALYLGGFMVAGHNIWEYSPRVITTIIAWIALLKGFWILTSPQQYQGLAQSVPNSAPFIRFLGLIVVGLGSLIFYFS